MRTDPVLFSNFIFAFDYSLESFPVKGARYNAGSPNARSQSLANRIAFESNSQAGEELLQLPPVKRLSCPLVRSRSHMCTGPSCADS